MHRVTCRCAGGFPLAFGESRGKPAADPLQRRIIICLGNNARRAISLALASVGERFNNAANYRARARAHPRRIRDISNSDPLFTFRVARGALSIDRRFNAPADRSSSSPSPLLSSLPRSTAFYFFFHSHFAGNCSNREINF